MRKMELTRKRKAGWDDVERKGNKHSMAGLDAESTSASASTEDQPMVEEWSKTVV